jgi:hypothetical protein
VLTHAFSQAFSSHEGAAYIFLDINVPVMYDNARFPIGLFSLLLLEAEEAMNGSR